VFSGSCTHCKQDDIDDFVGRRLISLSLMYDAYTSHILCVDLQQGILSAEAIHHTFVRLRV
jgi:hypothetical protein